MKTGKRVTLGLGPSCMMIVSLGVPARLRGVLAELGVELCGLEPLTAWPWGSGHLIKGIPFSCHHEKIPMWALPGCQLPAAP